MSKFPLNFVGACNAVLVEKSFKDIKDMHKTALEGVEAKLVDQYPRVEVNIVEFKGITTISATQVPGYPGVMYETAFDPKTGLCSYKRSGDAE